MNEISFALLFTASSAQNCRLVVDHFALNSQQAQLLDAASGIHIKFRLAGVSAVLIVDNLIGID